MSYPGQERGRIAQYPASVTLNAQGVGSVIIQNNNVAAQWRVEQVSLRTVPPIAGVTCMLYQNVQLIDTSYFAGTGDNAAGDPPVYLNSGEFIRADFTQGPANGQAIVVAYYEELI